VRPESASLGATRRVPRAGQRPRAGVLLPAPLC